MSTPAPDSILLGDCIEMLEALEEPIADLVFADPPFNIGYAYDEYHDFRPAEVYVDWTRRWMRACSEKALRPTGSFWIAIGDDHAADVVHIGKRDLGLTLRNWVLWHYTFGQNTKAKYARAHTHLLYFTKDPREFTFNDDVLRVFSDRQKHYADRRANPAGKLPDDVWNEYSRLCGTFAERRGHHPCQMPESILGRIIRGCSNHGDLVLDPFLGSGTTAVVAAKMGRRYISIDISQQYVDEARKRIAEATSHQNRQLADGVFWPDLHVDALWCLYAEDDVFVGTLVKEPYLIELFTRQLNTRIAGMYAHDHAPKPYGEHEIVTQLRRMASRNRLPRLRSETTGRAKQKERSRPSQTQGELFGDAAFGSTP